MINDLFETPELIPRNVRKLLNSFNESERGYKECERLKHNLNLIGYDIDYYLDAQPFNLVKL